MSDEGKPISPEHIFKKIVWRSTLALGGVLEQSTTWTLTGVAAILALLVSKIDTVSKIYTVSKIVSPTSLRNSIILFTLSILAAVVSKQLGIGIANGLKTMSELDGVLSSREGQQLIYSLEKDGRQLVLELAQPFWWPFSALFRRSGEKGLSDYLAGEKSLVRMLNFQIYLNGLHGILASAALLILAFSI